MSENISVDEVCRLLETLDEWESVALHLGLSDEMIQAIRDHSGEISLRREAMVSKWVHSRELDPSWSKLEYALVRANQEAHAAKIRARSREATPTTASSTVSSTSAPSPSSLGRQKKAIDGRDAGE